MKYFALRYNIVGAVTRYIPMQSKLIQLAGIAFVRTVVATKDDMYLRQIVRGDQLRPLMEDAPGTEPTRTIWSPAQFWSSFCSVVT